jgi:hypothetical protein
MAIGPNGHLYVSQISPHQIAEFAPDGTVVRVLGQGVFRFSQPGEMAVDDAGRVFVTQGPSEDPEIVVFAADGTLLGGWAPGGLGPDQLGFAAGIALDGQGGLIVMDSDPDAPRLVRYVLAPPFVD